MVNKWSKNKINWNDKNNIGRINYEKIVKALLLVICGGVLFTVSGCGNNGTSSTTTSTTEVNESSEVHVSSVEGPTGN